ncbi:MAG: hypothetical protein KDD47_02380 [Acidobacteria bacterium]|nr:hypothetical protein [Acidobacteriota bacterium]
MACISSDGTLTEAARNLLAALSDPLEPEEIGRRVGQPLYRVRSSLREMSEAGLVSHAGGNYQVTDAGRQRLEAPV